jgi:hypothetical protein
MAQRRTFPTNLFIEFDSLCRSSPDQAGTAAQGLIGAESDLLSNLRSRPVSAARSRLIRVTELAHEISPPSPNEGYAPRLLQPRNGHRAMIPRRLLYSVSFETTACRRATRNRPTPSTLLVGGPHA